MTRAELIAALEAEKWPNKALDEAIHKLVRPDDYARRERRFESVFQYCNANGLKDRRESCWRDSFYDVPRYTLSLDAALTLVPDGFYVRKLAEFSDGWYCTIINGGQNFSGGQKPAAIALCIAALKAAEVKK